jgi:hypothetical protein
MNIKTLSIMSILFMSMGVQTALAESCVTTLSGKKRCGKPMLGGVFTEVEPGYCLIYYEGKQGQHVDCKNPKKKLSNEH